MIITVAAYMLMFSLKIGDFGACVKEGARIHELTCEFFGPCDSKEIASTQVPNSK